MSTTLAFGPLTFTYGLLLAIAGGLLGSFAGKLAGRDCGVDIEPLLFRMVLAGLVAARLAFVVQFRDGYLQEPLGILDIRDGGWSPFVGLAVAAVYAVVAALRRPGWRKPLAAAIATAGAVWLLGALSLSMMPDEDGKLPPIAVQSLEGQVVPLASFQGKPTVVNLWATWCPPCRREMPVLQQAQAQRPEVNFVFLNQGESPDRVRSFLAAQNLPLRNVLLDVHGRAGVELGHRALPTTLFYDASGRLVDTRVGELSHASLSQRLGMLATQPESRPDGKPVILTPTSAGKAAALLASKNPADALATYERGHVADNAKVLGAGRPKPLGDGGLTPLASIPPAIQSQLDANEKLMASLRLQATPAFAWRD